MDSDYFSQSQSRFTASQLKHSSPAGTINKIRMINFMCHDNLEVQLNPRINFIVGKNGSGKSAIQTAIAVGLGGKALTTNRGSSLKGLIKSDKNTCTITIEISNEGESAFKPETYGHCIKVERSFTQTSGNYKIKNANGKVVSTEKRELDRIVRHFNIQPENPLCILHQDVARNFLNSSDPKNKYKFYQKASRFYDITKLYNESTYRVHTIKEIINTKFKRVEEAFTDLYETKKKLKILEDAKKKRELCSKLEKEILWAEVNEWHLELKKLQKKLNTENQALKASQQELRHIEENSAEEQMSELKSKLVEMDEMVKDAREKLEAAREKFLKKKDKFTKTAREVNEVKHNVKRTKSQYESCKTEIEKLIKSAPEMKQRQENLRKELCKQAELLESLKAAERNFEHEKQQLNDTIEVTRQNLQAVDLRYNDLIRQKGKKTEQVRHLSQSTSNLSIYGEAITAIVEEIERATRQRKFIKKPVGPIGLYISVRDSKWTAAVENFLGKGFLSSFCVDNAKDSAILSSILKNVCSRHAGGQPPIICSKFLQNMHNIRQNETGTQQYSNLARALEINNPVVANCLIDQMEIETVLLIPTNNEAYHLLDEERKVPINCKKSFTLTGDQFIPAPNYKSYSAMRPVTRATLLQAKQEDLIRELKNEINRLTHEISEVEKEKTSTQHQLGETMNSLRKNECELRNLRKRRFDTEQRIRQIQQEDKDSENQTNVGFLEEESETLKNNFEAESKKLQMLKKECDTAKEDYEEAKTAYEKYQSTIEESNRQKAPIQGEIQRLKSIIQAASSKADLMKQQMREHAHKIGQIEKNIQEVKNTLATTTENARQSCGEHIDTNRSKDEVEKELNATKTYLRSLEEKAGGSVDVLQTHLDKRQKNFDTVTKGLTDLRNLVEKTRSALAARKYKQIKLQHIIMNSAKHNFQNALKERNFEGKLEFDPKAETLQIKVSRPSHEIRNQQDKRLDTSSLSGGEKSYSTVCFIMALWQEIELPFHFMDEFDVFMDGINRRIVIDMLLSHAERTCQQFVFLTPLDASSVPASDIITIHRLEEPRK